MPGAGGEASLLVKMQSADAIPRTGSLPPILSGALAGRRSKEPVTEIYGADTDAAGVQGNSTRHPEIMVPVDFSPASNAAADYAIKVARCGRARLILLHAIHLNLTPYGPANPAWLRAGLCSEALEKMEGIMARARQAGVPVISVIEEGAPARVISRAAKRWKVALMVMAAKKRGKWTRFLGQRIRRKVVRGVECPIILIHTETKDGATA